MRLHLKLSLDFKIQYLIIDADDYLIKLDFGVSSAILNPVDVSCRWCMLSFLDLCETYFLNR